MNTGALEILDDFYFIERGFLSANHFAWRGKAPVLIDTGFKTRYAETASILKALGIAVESVARIINTHTHCDHIGGNRAIQAQSGCNIALHPVGRRFMDTRDARSPWWAYYHQPADFFEATETLEDGETVYAGPHAFKVIHTPGHASDGLVLFNRRHGLLISSDTLWARDIPVMTLKIEGPRAVETMLASLAKISHLDVRRAFPGHGPPFSDFPAALKRAEDRYRRYLEDPARIGWDLVKKIIIFTLMMRGRIPTDTFYDFLMQTAWYPETVDAYLGGGHALVFERVIAHLAGRKLIRRIQGHWVTTVKP